jgi:hypothetical protein
LTLYAEHEFNASTFTARVLRRDAIGFLFVRDAAIGTLRGPLARRRERGAMELIERFDSPAQRRRVSRRCSRARRRSWVSGTAVYRTSDPRNAVIKPGRRSSAPDAGDRVLYPVSEAIETLLWREKKLFPNLDFYSASAYRFLGIPDAAVHADLRLLRVSGWAAHVFEQRANNKLIRPTADYIGPEARAFVPLREPRRVARGGRGRDVEPRALRRGLRRGGTRSRALLGRGRGRNRLVEAMAVRARCARGPPFYRWFAGAELNTCFNRSTGTSRPDAGDRTR